MKNLLISNMNEKDVDHFTSNIGLKLRKNLDRPFKKMCNIFTNANIIRQNDKKYISDEDYFENLSIDKVPLSNYNIDFSKNNIIVERYPELESDESYIFVCNHTCPEDIETVLNVLDRNAYLVLGSVETLKYDPEMYLSWLNGMIPFDILDKDERKNLMNKMRRVIKTNSILIFPEGSHNYNPNKLINNLFDGPVNLSLQTGKKIVIVTLVRDQEKNISYIDVSNPVNFDDFSIKNSDNEKEYVNSLSSCIRDKMATAVYCMISRHFDLIERGKFSNIEQYFRNNCINDAFKKLKWNHDVFDAEYLVKKSKEEKEYEDVVNTLSNLKLNLNVLNQTQLCNRKYVLQKLDLEQKDVANMMRNYWLQENKKKIIKKV